jgi:lipoprotein-releasing system permease protein
MYLKFAWRYLRAKKSANAINWIAWVTVGVIAFATACQILVLSVFNGFEGLVKSLYHSFYADIRIDPRQGSLIRATTAQLDQLRRDPDVQSIHPLLEEKALLQQDSLQTVVQLRGVDESYLAETGMARHIFQGKALLGDAENPRILLGAGIQNAIDAQVEGAFEASTLTAVMPRYGQVMAADPLQSLAEGNLRTEGVFAIQQEFDNNYALVPLAWMRQMQGTDSTQFSALDIRLKPQANPDVFRTRMQSMTDSNWVWKTRYEQNATLYQTMRAEKWAIYAILTLILLIAAFNMISALTMLVLEKKKDISILRSLGASAGTIRRLFLTEGLLLGVIGTGCGFVLALIIGWLQVTFKLIKLEGGSFLIDYFPVSLQGGDFVLVGCTAIGISILAAWLPAQQASKQPIDRQLSQ